MSSDWSHEPHALRRCWCGEKAAREVLLEDWRCRRHLQVDPPAPSPVDPVLADPPAELPAILPVTRRAQVWELIRQQPGVSVAQIGAAIGQDKKAVSVFLAELRREAAITPAGEPLRVLRLPAPQRIRGTLATPRPCSAEGCKKIVRTGLDRAFCRAHYEAERSRSGRKWADMAASDAAIELVERIEAAPILLRIGEICAETGYSYTHVCQLLIALRKAGKIQPASPDRLIRPLGVPAFALHCREPGCSGEIEAKGLCDAHYRRAIREQDQILGRVLRAEDDPAQPGALTRLVIVLDRPADPAIEGQRVRVVTQ